MHHVFMSYSESKIQSDSTNNNASTRWIYFDKHNWDRPDDFYWKHYGDLYKYKNNVKLIESFEIVSE